MTHLTALLHYYLIINNISNNNELGIIMTQHAHWVYKRQYGNEIVEPTDPRLSVVEWSCCCYITVYKSPTQGLKLSISNRDCGGPDGQYRHNSPLDVFRFKTQEDCKEKILVYHAGIDRFNPKYYYHEARYRQEDCRQKPLHYKVNPPDWLMEKYWYLTEISRLPISEAFSQEEVDAKGINLNFKKVPYDLFLYYGKIF